MKRKVSFGIASAAVIALAIALNTNGSISKIRIVNATEQATNIEKSNGSIARAKDIRSEEKVVTKNNRVEQPGKAQVDVPVDMEVEKGDQKNADAGSSPWKLDPLFVSQVFVSLQISQEGIQGDYPVKQGELKLVNSNEKEAIVEVYSSKTDIKSIYLKRLIKQDNTGVWTVVGYDLKS